MFKIILQRDCFKTSNKGLSVDINICSQGVVCPCLGLNTCIKALKYIPGPGVRWAFTGPLVLWFCCNLLIWLVTMATKRQNLWKIIKKSTPQKLFGNSSWNFAELFLILASRKKLFFIAVTYALWLLWQLKFPVTYNGKMRFIAIPLQIFWQKFYRNVCWVVLHQAYHFSSNFPICSWKLYGG